MNSDKNLFFDRSDLSDKLDRLEGFGRKRRSSEEEREGF